ncbi:hypothetical protein [Sphingopyxis sp. MWB1]|uniref:hypothetical protein n=1 Tax=Sphingopyxis sp. MWB1 TaxID=1537715 RepID=UPI000519EF06|nr:hypothetical protein [Sphingopyxis sp. MWB1]
MPFLKKTAAILAATSVVTAPVAALAAPVAAQGVDISSASDQSELSGNASWIIGLIGLIGGVTAMVLAADDNDDDPVSP